MACLVLHRLDEHAAGVDALRPVAGVHPEAGEAWQSTVAYGFWRTRSLFSCEIMLFPLLACVNGERDRLFIYLFIYVFILITSIL